MGFNYYFYVQNQQNEVVFFVLCELYIKTSLII